MRSLPVFEAGPEPVAFVLLDDEDANRYADVRLRLWGGRYAAFGSTLLHRAILGLKPGDPRQGDHRNRDKLDCRRENLRISTPARNAQNVPGRPGTSRFRGVAWYAPRGYWQAYVTVRYRKIKLGYRHDEVEAALLAEAARRELLPFSEPDPELALVLAERELAAA